MGYVVNNLMPKESVIYQAQVHWFVFLPAVLLFLMGTTFLSSSEEAANGGAIFIGLGIFFAVKAYIQRASTELAVTSKRVIAKVGLIRRSTVELNHSKVESFNVDQGILGRIFGYGTVTVNGTGGVRTPIPNVENPLEFRRQAMAAIDESQG